MRCGWRWRRRRSTSTTSTGAWASWSRCPPRRPTRWAWTCAGWWRPRAGRRGLVGPAGGGLAKTALGGIAEYAIAARPSAVFDAPPELDDAEATAFLHPVPDRPTWPCSAGVAWWRARRWWSTRRPAAWAPPASNWPRPAGARVIAVAGGPEKGPAVRRPGRRPGHRPPRARTSSRPCWPPPTTRGADVVYDLTGGDFVASVVAVHGPRRAATWPWASPTTRERHDRTAAAHGLHRQHRHRRR